MFNRAASEEGASRGGGDEAGVGDGAGVIADRSDPGIEAPETGIGTGVGSESDLETGGEDRLACRGGDGAFVADIGTDEEGAAAVAVGVGADVQLGAGLDDDIAVAATGGEGRGWGEVWGAIGTAGEGEGGEKELGVAIVEEALFDEVIVDWQGGDGEGAEIDLGRAAEEDAILVDQVGLAFTGDLAEDLGGGAAGVVDFVESDPLALIGAACGLVKF